MDGAAGNRRRFLRYYARSRSISQCGSQTPGSPANVSRGSLESFDDGLCTVGNYCVLYLSCCEVLSLASLLLSLSPCIPPLLPRCMASMATCLRSTRGAFPKVRGLCIWLFFLSLFPFSVATIWPISCPQRGDLVSVYHKGPSRRYCEIFLEACLSYGDESYFRARRSIVLAVGSTNLASHGLRSRVHVFLRLSARYRRRWGWVGGELPHNLLTRARWCS